MSACHKNTPRLVGRDHPGGRDRRPLGVRRCGTAVLRRDPDARRRLAAVAGAGPVERVAGDRAAGRMAEGRPAPGLGGGGARGRGHAPGGGRRAGVRHRPAGRPRVLHRPGGGGRQATLDLRVRPGRQGDGDHAVAGPAHPGGGRGPGVRGHLQRGLRLPGRGHREGGPAQALPGGLRGQEEVPVLGLLRLPAGGRGPADRLPRRGRHDSCRPRQEERSGGVGLPGPGRSGRPLRPRPGRDRRRSAVRRPHGEADGRGGRGGRETALDLRRDGDADDRHPRPGRPRGHGVLRQWVRSGPRPGADLQEARRVGRGGGVPADGRRVRPVAREPDPGRGAPVHQPQRRAGLFSLEDRRDGLGAEARPLHVHGGRREAVRPVPDRHSPPGVRRPEGVPGTGGVHARPAGEGAAGLDSRWWRTAGCTSATTTR
jgi:hypothetical protein